MEREDVRIALDDDSVRVHATFWFRNRGPATDARGKRLRKDEPPYVRLRDVFAALGGTYRYGPSEERVELSLPERPGR